MKWLSKSDVRIVSVLLAISVLLGSIPLSAGAIITSSPKEATFTLNICEPLQTGLTVSMTQIARPAASPPRLALLEQGKLSINPPRRLNDLSIAPESPPPKTIV